MANDVGDMSGWRAYYADGATYDSRNTDWADLPSAGIVGVIVFYNDPYRHIIDGGDWFYLDETGHPECSDTHDEWGEWVDPPDVPREELKRGDGMADEEWADLHDEMVDDKTWP